MAQLSFNNIKLCGVSACVPKNVVRNVDYDWITEEERNLLIKTTGVIEKRIASAHVTTTDLCFQAAEKLLQELQWKKNEIEALVFVSQSGDYNVPASAVILQNRLGLSKNCMAFDIGLGCSGYVYGLSVVGSLIAGGIKKALLLVGDKSSVSVSPKDKSTYPLFGDAGTATALKFDDSSPLVYLNLQSDGSGFENIIITDGLCRNVVTEESLKMQFIDKGIERRPLDLALNGTAIFDFALREVIPNIKNTLSFSNNTLESIDYYILHQANMLINETLRKMMKVPVEKVPYSIHHYGNTSSASIPLTIVTKLKNKVENENLKLLFCGFGVGLSWGSAIIETSNVICPDIIEYNE